MAKFAMGWSKPDNVAGSSAPAILIGIFVATGGLLFGYDTGYATVHFIRNGKRFAEMRRAATALVTMQHGIAWRTETG
jgi:hypothetical protein